MVVLGIAETHRAKGAEIGLAHDVVVHREAARRHSRRVNNGGADAKDRMLSPLDAAPNANDDSNTGHGAGG